MKTVRMEQMTSPQIRQAIQDGYRTAIVPVGSIEQHGKHLPIGTDAMLACLLAERIAEGLGDALVAPVIRPGCSDHHMAFAGTISFPPHLLQELCRVYCHCLSHHGFEYIALIPTHGGNFAAMEEIAPVIDAELPCKVRYVNILQESRAFEARQRVPGRWGVTPEEGGVHAGAFETSLLLASVYREWIDMKAAERGFVGDARARLEEMHRAARPDIAQISPNGVLGDPTRATEEIGRALLDALVPMYVELVREALGYSQRDAGRKQSSGDA
jgi:creatinine amidohydrolase